MEKIPIESPLWAASAVAIKPIPDHDLRHALTGAFADAADAVAQCERFFSVLSTRRWSQPLMAKCLASWKATHLKMLAIYGLSCRLQRLAFAAVAPARELLFVAAALNAETSHEDLGIDYDGVTHAALYEDLANAFVSDQPWQSESYCIPEARAFQRWIYRNMVVGEVPLGLFTNMFSEVYNHGEYTIALAAFSRLVDQHHHFDGPRRERALTYIRAHVAGETEVRHFLVVVEALAEYARATGYTLDYGNARTLFCEYLTRLGGVFQALTDELMKELHQENTRLGPEVACEAS